MERAGAVAALLRPLSSAACQAYFCDSLQLADIIEWVVMQCGVSTLSVSSFSAGEEFLRRLWRLRDSGMVDGCTLILDARAMKKTGLLSAFLAEVTDRVYVARNHSKVVLVEGSLMSAAIVTSQNLTRGNRTEAGMVITDHDAVNGIRRGMTELINKSTLINGTNSGTD